MTTRPKRKRANGEGSIRYDDARKRWEGRITVGQDRDGQPVRKKVTGSTRAEVTKRLAEARDHADSGITAARRDLTIGRFLTDWADTVLPGSVAPSTEQQYSRRGAPLRRARDRRQAAPHPRPPATSPRCSSALDARGLSPNTMRLARSVLRRALRWAEAEGQTTRNVAAIAFGVKVPAPEGARSRPI